MADYVYGDQFGDIIDRPEIGVIEIRWFDATASMSADEFQTWLSGFVTELEQRGRRRVLVDTTQFRMDPALMNAAWRDAHIIPRYNAAGVERFAFHMPSGMPLIGRDPAPEGPGEFPTVYFGSRNDIVAWLTD